MNKGNRVAKRYNLIMIIYVIICAFSSSMPYFIGGTYSMNHRILIVFSVIAFAWHLFYDRFIVSMTSLVAFLAAFFAGVNVFITSGVVNFDYYIKWLIFFESILIYYVTLSGAGHVSEKTINLVFWLGVVQCILHFIHSFDSQYYIKMWSGTYLQLIYGNKNSTAMHLLLLGCVFALSYLYYKKHNSKLKRALSIMMFVLVIWMIYMTGSRSSLIGIVFIVPFVVTEKISKIVKPPFILFFLLFPFIFAIIYVALYKIGLQGRHLIGRKFFNGREQMWLPVFDGFPLGWIVGMFSEFAQGTMESNVFDFQLHNSIMDLIASYGAIVAGAFLWAAYKVLLRLYNTGKYINIIIVVCVLALILQSTGEAAIMSGTRAIFVCQLFLFCDFESGDIVA